MSLKMWKNETDWVIAETKEEAIKVWEEHTGESWQAYVDDTLDAGWSQLNPTEALSFICDLYDYKRDDYPEEARHNGSITIEAKVHEWTKHADKPGFWGSTEH